ncbi:hypothetical protein IIA79_05695 [bacterium]|nr:hypothetical protein [bacterium]
MFYISEDGRSLNLLRQDVWQEWLIGETQVLASADGEETITEFAVHTLGQVSYSNYVVYSLNGNLYLLYCGNPSFDDWQQSILIDDSGDCRSLEIILIGSDAEFSSFIFVTYISDDEEGVPRINFRDLRLALEP